MAYFSLQELAEKALQREQDKPQQILKYQATINLNNVASSLWYDNETIAIFELSKNNFYKTKERLFTCGWLDKYCIQQYSSRILDYGISHICYAILSDNEELIQQYAKLRYTTFYYEDGTREKKPLHMDEMVLEGESAIWCSTIQLFMANDIVGVERNLNIIETKTLPELSKKEDGLRDDYEFYKALLANNKSKMEEVLNKLVSPKIHKKRNDNPVLNQYISLPALGYAKLAWRKGIEVDVNSPLIPKELLPIQPLEHYEIPYEFLKENK